MVPHKYRFLGGGIYVALGLMIRHGTMFLTIMTIPATPVYFFLPALGLLATHIVAMHYHLYWYLPWFDIFMHLWGGYLVIIGLLMIGSIGSRRLYFPDWSLAPVLGLVMLGWEVFEYVFGVAGTHPSYLVDTTLDIIFGALGGLIAYGSVRRV